MEIEFKCEDSGAKILWYDSSSLIVTDDFSNDYVRSFSVSSGYSYSYSVSELLSIFQPMFVYFSNLISKISVIQ